MSMHRPSFRTSRRLSQQANTPSRRAVRDAAWYACEKLESRRLLTTLTGGGVAADGTLLENTLTYLDGNQNQVKIALWGTVTAEFLFLRTNPDNSTLLVNAVAPSMANVTAKAGADLFAVYVASASPTASISIGEITNTTTGLVGGFTSGAPNAITVSNAQGGGALVVNPGANAGGVYLGGRLFLTMADGTLATSLTNGIPILSVPLTSQIGVRPVNSAGELYAGVVTAPGVSLNRFFLGGELTGRVDIGGSINTFYAGAIYTGDATGLLNGTLPTTFGGEAPTGGSGGLLPTDSTVFQHNFNVAGDLENLITADDIGTNGVLASGQQTYNTGFFLSVGGHIGQVKSADSISGSVYAENLPTLKESGAAQQSEEITGPTPPGGSGESFFEGNAPDSDGTLGTRILGVPSLSEGGGAFIANSAVNAQFLGTPFSSALGHNAIQLTGTLDGSGTTGHNVDYYGVALGANQTVTATLTVPEIDIDTAGPSLLEMGIIAPDDAYAPSPTALLASTYDSHGLGNRLVEQPITFTSTDAGVYYFAVGYVGDTDFTGAGGLIGGAVNYQLGITGVKNLGIGAVAAVNNIGLQSGVGLNFLTGVSLTDPSVQVDNGDLGALISTGGGFVIGGNLSGFANPITVKTGNIRVIQAGSIGTLSAGNATTGATGVVDFGPDIDASGNVGVIRATDASATGVLFINQAFDDNLTATGTLLTTPANVSKPIGGSYQLIDCAGLFAGNLVADAGIGTIRAANVGLTNLAPVWHVNADNKGNDGLIDLVDVTGTHFGTLGAGGPKILTGPNGNLRYLRIAPAALIFNDNFFGGEQDLPILYAAGQAARLIDDSGTPFTITPFLGGTVNGDVTAPATGTTTTGTTSTLGGDTLSLQTYGIEDKGGVVVSSVTVNPGTVAVNTGGAAGAPAAGLGPTSISVTSSANGIKDINASVDFGQINMLGNGTPIAFTLGTNIIAPVVGAAAVDDSATFNGKIPINIFSYTAANGATSVVNNTSGEIVNFQAPSVELLSAASLGVAKSDTGAPVSGATVLSNVFPFHNQRTLIQIAGVAETIESSGPLGNILVNGTIGSILADDGAAAAKGTAEGITGPIYAVGAAGNAAIGDILNVNIGNGLGYSGSGNYAITGIFADNYIGTITNQHGSDIRGDIVASGVANGLPTDISTVNPTTGVITVTLTASAAPYINNITLSGGGSIIGAQIFTTTTLPQAIQSTASIGGYLITNPNLVTNANTATALFAVGTISTSGDGGIIGSIILTGGTNIISVKGGFGIINSEILSLSTDVVNSIVADGYGIRSSVIEGQNSINSINATGNGKELSVTRFSKSVRQSETGATTDAFSGQPLDVFDDLDRFLGTSAKRSTRKGSTEGGVIADTTITGTFGLGSINAFRIVGHPIPVATTFTQLLAQAIDGTPAMTINIANNIGKITVRENTTDLALTTGTLNTFSSGKVVYGSDFTVAGQIKSFTGGFINGSTHINAQGPDGVIDYLSTTAGLNANINAAAGIGEILVGTDLGSTNVSSGGNLDELYVKHSVLKGANVTVARTLKTLVIRHNLLGGSTIQARAVTKKTIGGISNGNIIIVPTTP